MSLGCFPQKIKHLKALEKRLISLLVLTLKKNNNQYMSDVNTLNRHVSCVLLHKQDDETKKLMGLVMNSHGA